MDTLLSFVVALLIVFLVLWLIRQVVLWYFKIDVHIKNQEEIIRLLKKIADK